MDAELDLSMANVMGEFRQHHTVISLGQINLIVV